MTDPFVAQRAESRRFYEREWKRAAAELLLDPDTRNETEITRIGDRMRLNHPGRY